MFKRITQQAIRRGTFRSVKELVEKIDHYVQNSNRIPLIMRSRRMKELSWFMISQPDKCSRVASSSRTTWVRGSIQNLKFPGSMHHLSRPSAYLSEYKEVLAFDTAREWEYVALDSG